MTPPRRRARRRHRIVLIAVAPCVVAATAATTVAHADAGTNARPQHRFTHLSLGPADLVETRTTSQLQPGVTLTRIHRGTADPADFWTIDVIDKVDVAEPDPDAPPALIFSRGSAAAEAASLTAAGFSPRVEPVDVPPTDDYYPGLLGYRVRVGHYATQADATSAQATLAAAGFPTRYAFTGWDGDSTDKGPWNIDVLTVDPRKFRGSLKTTFGPDIQSRETTSQLVALNHATAGTNGGYFVLNPAAGAPGDPAGVGVYGGQLLSEANGRPGLVLHSDARDTRIQHLSWHGTVAGDSTQVILTGVNRVPGLIRNCGEQPGEQPTALAQHDVTCTDPDETVLFTDQFGPSTPSGPGAEIVLDPSGTILSISAQRGTALQPGQRSIQAIGRDVANLQGFTFGQHLTVQTGLTDSRTGAPVDLTPDTYVANGGPVLVKDGMADVTPLQDGLVRATEPSEYYGFAARRNPRTIAGTTARGDLVLITADGRSTESLGLSITEEASVATSLGLTQAMNLDGGGSTTMVANGALVNTPSDTSGERPVGDAVLIEP